MNTLIVEPHPDDIVLSMHGILCSEIRKDWGDIFVLTISDVNGRDSRKYCDSIGVGLVDMETLGDINFGENKLNANAVRAAANPWLMQRSIYGNNFGDELVEVSTLIKNAINKYNIDMIVGPVGIFHPLHVIVSIAIEILDIPAFIKMFYADTPYQFRVYGSRTLDDFVSQGFCPCYNFKPSEDDVKDKLKLFRRCYPTESVHWDENKFIDFSEQLYWKDEV